MYREYPYKGRKPMKSEMDISGLAGQIKLNCNISDAGYWGYYSICGLLMRYRDIYRNEHSMMPWEKILTEEITPWIAEREMLWQGLENSSLKELQIENRRYDPFDIEGIGAALKGSGLIYGSGYGMFLKPTFFLGYLEGREELYDYNIFYVGKELCRDLFAAPTMLQGRCIYVRKDILKIILWEKLLQRSMTKYSGTLNKYFSEFDLDGTAALSDGFFERIDLVVNIISRFFVMHEIGEAVEDDYSHDWANVLGECGDKFVEIYMRGIKDVLADTSFLGPLNALIKNQDQDLMDLYMVFLEGMRKELFPEIRDAYRRYTGNGDWSLIEEARVAGYEKACKLREDVLTLRKDSKDQAAFIAALKKYAGNKEKGVVR